MPEFNCSFVDGASTIKSQTLITMEDQRDIFIFVGTYTRPLGHVQGRAKGFHVLRHSAANNVFEVCARNIDGLGDGPSYLALLRHSFIGDMLRASVVACNEGGPEMVPGTLSFANVSLNTRDGSCTIDSRGEAVIGPPTPCHVATNGPKSWALAATYFGGSISSHHIDMSGDCTATVGDATCVVKNELCSLVVPERQEAAHAHQALFLSDSVVLLCDLGADCVLSYNFSDGVLSARDSCSMPPGSGPRHCAVHPTKQFVFVVGELNNTVYACAVSSESSSATLQIVASFPCEPIVGGGAAAIVVSPNGSLVFVSVRRSDGHDAVHAIYFDTATASLSAAGCLPVGLCPRDICLHPTASFIYVASQNGDTVSAYPFVVQDKMVQFHSPLVVQCETPVSLVPISAQ